MDSVAGPIFAQEHAKVKILIAGFDLSLPLC